MNRLAREYRYFTIEERRELARMYEAGESVYQIAKHFERYAPSIYTELLRGSTGKLDQNNRTGYDPELAERNVKQNISRRGNYKKDRDLTDTGQESLYGQTPSEER